MSLLEQLYKHHKDWVSFTKCFINNYAEDLVQEMYIKISKVPQSKYIKEGEIQKNYIFTILRNLCLDYHRANKKVTKVEWIADYQEDFKEQPESLEQIQHKHEQHKEIRKLLFEEERFLEMYYMIYTDAENPSYRDIEQKTGINLNSIHNDIQRVKKTIKAKYNGKPM